MSTKVNLSLIFTTLLIFLTPLSFASNTSNSKDGFKTISKTATLNEPRKTPEEILAIFRELKGKKFFGMYKGHFIITDPPDCAAFYTDTDDIWILLNNCSNGPYTFYINWYDVSSTQTYKCVPPLHSLDTNISNQYSYPMSGSQEACFSSCNY